MSLQRQKLEPIVTSHTDAITKKLQSYSYANNQLYGDLPGTGGQPGSGMPFMDTFSMANKLGMSVPNLAPNVDMYDESQDNGDVTVVTQQSVQFPPGGVEIGPQPADGPRKKKYAKEAWPGRKPSSHVGLLM